MDFFDAQEQSRRRSKRLVWLFVLAVITVTAAVTALLTGLLWFVGSGEPGTQAAAVSWEVPSGIATVTLIVIGLASLVRVVMLRAGGSVIAREQGGELVTHDTPDPQLKRLVNVVDEMAIASGVPCPEIYVLRSEPSINAFAAGYYPQDAAVAVTQGALDQLSRDELQGVIAHEFSHVLNGDMQLNIRLMGPLFGILLIGIMGRGMLRGASRSRIRSRDNRGQALMAVLGLGLMVIGYTGVFFARLIKAAVSRQREYLADASAVQFTRQTSGIAGALKKIGGMGKAARMHENRAEDVSHMLFSSGSRFWLNMLATHPPLLERIQLLDPAFKPDDFDRFEPAARGDDPDAVSAGFAAGSAGDTTDAAALTATVGNPSDEHVAMARMLATHIPPSIASALGNPDTAMLLVLALMVDGNREAKEPLLGVLGRQLGENRTRLLKRLLGELETVGDGLRLPLVDLAFPALRQLTDVQREHLEQLLAQLAEDDGRITLYEYALLRLVTTYVDRLQRPARQRGHTTSISSPRMRRAACRVIGALAWYGNGSDIERERAALRGMQVIDPSLGAADIALPDITDGEMTPVGWRRLDEALDRLDRLTPGPKQTLVEALTTTSLHDGRISLAESELLRCVCAILNCPLPPVLTAAAT